MPNWTNEQKLAINLDHRNILVSAGAGSGKTAVLTERVLNKVRNGVKINELLILTFTRAAALEMKERIRKALIKEGFTDEVMLLDSCYITTFDSFALAIVKRYHYLLGLDKNIEITPSCIIDIKKRKIIEEIFEEYYDDNNLEVLNEISNFCLKDDKNLKNSIYDLNEKIDQLVDKEGYLNNYFNEYDQKINNQIKFFEETIKDKLKNIEILFYELESCYEGKDIDKIIEIKESLFSDFSLYKLTDKLNFDLPRKNKNCKEEYSNIKDNIKKFVEELKILLIYQKEEDFIVEVNKTKSLQKIIIDVILKLESRIANYKKEKSLFTFYDIAKKAIEVVRDNEDVRLELQEEFNEIMIDEYQDTSDIQETFISMISKNNVYMVGDMKQSIYGFRNANPELFKYKYYSFDNPSINSLNTKIDLLHNFRSRKEVVDSINDIFKEVMDERFGGVDYRKGHQMNQGNHSYDTLPENILEYQNMFDLELIEYCNEKNYSSSSEQEAFIVCNDIINKMKNNYKVFDKSLLEKGLNPYRTANYSDFSILVDRTKDFDLYKKIFEFLEIPLQIYQDDSLLEGNNIILLCNIVKFVYLIYTKNYNEDFRYLYTSIARSFLFSEYDDVIFATIKNNLIYTTEIYIKAESIAKNIDSKTFKEIILSIIEEFNYYKKIHLVGNVDKAISEVEYLLTLTEVVNKCDNKLSSFVEFIDDIIKYKLKLSYSYSIGSQESVKLMTVHKSKGLEFPVVYCTGLSTKFNESEIKAQFLFDEKIGIICPYYQFGVKETFLKNNYVYLYKYNEISERIRLFYVMLTRAKEKIIFVLDSIEDKDKMLPAKLRKFKINNFKKIITGGLENLKYIHSFINTKELVNDDYKKIKNLNFSEIKKDVTKIRCENISIVGEKIIKQRLSKKDIVIDGSKEKALKKYGTDIHYILENINFEKALIDNQYLERLNINNFQRDLVKGFISLEIFKNLVNPKFFKELEFSYMKEDTQINGIIDLLIETDDKILIIDYKLKNITDQLYLSQIQGYRDFIKQSSTKEIVCFLYSIIDRTLKKI